LVSCPIVAYESMIKDLDKHKRGKLFKCFAFTPCEDIMYGELFRCDSWMLLDMGLMRISTVALLQLIVLMYLGGKQGQGTKKQTDRQKTGIIYFWGSGIRAGRIAAIGSADWYCTSAADVASFAKRSVAMRIPVPRELCKTCEALLVQINGQ
jgi:hypothetical protein